MTRARLLALALSLVVASCDGALHRMQDREARPDRAPPAGAVVYNPDDGADPALPAITRALLERGRDRFDRTCAACHGILGDGDSAVARAMTGRKPPSLLDQRVPDARILAAIEVGYGAMPALADVLPARDRFAVLQFVRALQRRDVAIDELPPAQRAEAERWLR